MLERWGQLIDRASAGITDPAELFAVGTRITGRLGWTHPEIAGFLAGAGLDVLDIPIGLAPRALRDIEAGKAAGRFTVSDAEIALSAAAGGMLGLFRMRQRHPERVTETTVDQLAEAESAHARRPRRRSRPPHRPPPPGHRHVVTPATMPPTASLVSNAGWPGRRGRGDRRPGDTRCGELESYRGLDLMPGVVIRPCSPHPR